MKANSLNNLVGALVPLAVSLAITPIFIRTVGTDRYGVLALVWLTFGYLGLFDLGISNSSTNAIARDAKEGGAKQGIIVGTTIVSNFVFGCVGSALILLLGPSLVPNSAFARELTATLPWLALALPVIIVGGALNAVLSGQERFPLLVRIGLVGTLLFQLLPLAAALFVSPRLTTLIPVALLGRTTQVLLTAVFVLRIVPARTLKFKRAQLTVLMKFGGAMLITGIVGPILISIDQFAIGYALGAAAVAHYAISFNLASKMLILPGAIAQSLFPRISYLGEHDARSTANHAADVITLALTLIAIPAILLAKTFFSLWIGPDFASSAGLVARILLLACAVNGSAFVAITFIQASGRPGTAARLHILETIPFLLALAAGLHFAGLIGAAIAWLFRVALDFTLLARASKILSRLQLLLLLSLSVITGLSFAAPNFAAFLSAPLWAFCAFTLAKELRNHVRALDHVVDRISSFRHRTR